MSANPSVDTHQANRLAVIRRFYLYGVVVVSLIVMLAAIDDLTRVLTDVLLGPKGLVVGETSFLRDTIARNAGALLVAAPLFLVHWYFVRRMLSLAPERLAALRKLALYGVALFALGMAAQHLHQWLYQSTALLLG
ncbi:MAG: hypothetical protein HY328_19810, partial [Chloroflexi bacterium]|nr:hypothetical protein [Chloroflexota bacterium]